MNRIIDEWQDTSFIAHDENSPALSHFGGHVPGDILHCNGPMGRTFHD
jgi:hypothetical protein